MIFIRILFAFVLLAKHLPLPPLPPLERRKVSHHINSSVEQNESPDDLYKISPDRGQRHVWLKCERDENSLGNLWLSAKSTTKEILLWNRDQYVRGEYYAYVLAVKSGNGDFPNVHKIHHFTCISWNMDSLTSTKSVNILAEKIDRTSCSYKSINHNIQHTRLQNSLIDILGPAPFKITPLILNYSHITVNHIPKMLTL